MEIGLSLGICRGGRVASFTPGSLTGLAATVLPAESLAAGLLWQDTAKTIAATADGDPVRVAVCPYTAVEFTAPSDAARPLLWDETAGKWGLFNDGVDDYYTFPTVTFAGQWTVYAAWSDQPASPSNLILVAGAGGTGVLGWIGGATFYALNAAGSGPDVSSSRTAGTLIARVRRDALNDVYLRLGSGAEVLVGNRTGDFAFDRTERNGVGQVSASNRRAAVLLIDDAVSAADDAALMDYLAALTP